MTVGNMSIEAGARAGVIAPDETTFAYLDGRERVPRGAEFEAAVRDRFTGPLRIVHSPLLRIEPVGGPLDLGDATCLLCETFLKCRQAPGEPLHA